MTTSALALRPHQIEAEHNIRGHMAAKARRVLLVAPTAFGKTETAISIILQAQARRSVVWFVVDRITLVEQTSRRFAMYGIDHGIIQSDHAGTDHSKLIQIGTAQTLARRTFETPPDLIFYDECHVKYKAILDLIERFPNAKVIGLSATPFRKGMADEWDALVNGATVNFLLAQGWLTPLKIKACVSPDMTGARLKNSGEYDEAEAGERGVTIVGDIVKTWIEQSSAFFGGPAKTIVFSPSVKHGQELCRQFADAGYNFQQISYLDRSDADRKDKIDEFRKPDSAIHGLVSCEVLTKGFDVPDVKIGISCRPYRKSFSGHIQEMGRVMRLAEGKEFGLWLDHSGNCISFAEDTAWLFEHGVESLSSAETKDSAARTPSEKVKSKHFCGNCGLQMAPGLDACPSCGWQRPERGSIRVVDGKLIDFDMGARNAFRPRDGLRADCLDDPKAIWNAALAYCMTKGRKGAEASRKWAYGIWAGIYPYSKLPYGLYVSGWNTAAVTTTQWSLIDREVSRFRKNRARAA